MGFSAYINYLNDYSMLSLLESQGQLDRYSEIVLVDGPYLRSGAWVTTRDAPMLDETEHGRSFLARNPRIRYFKKTWKDEFEKRVFGFNRCTGDIVVRHDSDEVLQWDEEAVKAFVDSDKSVARFGVQNLCLDGRGFGRDRPATLEAAPMQGLAFKKQEISAERHLDYIWLAGVKQSPPDLNSMYPTPLANAYHFTLMRDRNAHLQKFAFYYELNSGVATGNEHMRNIVRCLNDGVANGKLDSADAAETLFRGNPDFVGVPAPAWSSRIFDRLVIPELEDPLRKADAVRFRVGPENCRWAVTGYPVHMFVPDPDVREICLESLDGALDITADSAPVILGETVVEPLARGRWTGSKRACIRLSGQTAETASLLGHFVRITVYAPDPLPQLASIAITVGDRR